LKLVAVVQLTLGPDWFCLKLEERQKLRRQMFDLIGRHPEVEVRWFDADPWTGAGTEFLVCEFASLRIYWDFWNEIREHTQLHRPYATFDRVSLGLERPLTIGLVET
jgi:hypothetical protein